MNQLSSAMDESVVQYELQQASAEFASYSGTHAVKSLVTLLNALERSYCFDLVQVDAQRLPVLQAAIRQIRALRGLSQAHSTEPPKI